MSYTIPDRRREGRRRLMMEVRCRIAPGKSPGVWLSELSSTGCQILVREGLLTPGQYVVIKPKALEGLPGTVKWVLGDAVGIQFEQPLHEAVLAHLLNGSPASPSYRRSERVDGFDSPLPNLPRGGWPRPRSVL